MKFERFRALFLILAAGLLPAQSAESRASLELYGPYISQNEGFRNMPYQCTEGEWTVGVGHRLRTHEAVKVYTNREIVELFDRDLASAVDDARVLMPNFDAQPLSVRRVLVDMAFQLGRPGLKKFQGFLHKVQHRRYGGAQDELRYSTYYHQCTARADRNIERLSEPFRTLDK